MGRSRRSSVIVSVMWMLCSLALTAAFRSRGHTTVLYDAVLRKMTNRLQNYHQISNSKLCIKRESTDFDSNFDEVDLTTFKKKEKKPEGAAEHQFITKQYQAWYDSILKSLQTHLKTPLEPIAIPEDYAQSEGTLGKDKIVQFQCKAFQSSQLAYVRYVSFIGDGYYVFNFVVIPKLQYDLPILGIDIVVLPGNSIAAIDFQPLEQSPAYFQQDIYTQSKAKLAKWKIALPSGGDLRADIAKYFSPNCIWSKFPSTKNNALLFLIGTAIKEYTEIYTQALSSKTDLIDENEELMAIRRKQLEDYLDFRIVNDPAKNMLSASFGKGWTDTVLKEVIFPAAYIS